MSDLTFSDEAIDRAVAFLRATKSGGESDD